VRSVKYTDREVNYTDAAFKSERHSRLSIAASAALTDQLQPYTPTIESLITNKRASSFMRRLAKLDRETYERVAEVGAKGEPPIGDFAMRVNRKRCCFCKQSAQYSLACVLSSVGLSPREQKCSPVVLVCRSCLRELCDRVAPVSSELQTALISAYTALQRDNSTLHNVSES
jgi:hypothetical protein